MFVSPAVFDFWFLKLHKKKWHKVIYPSLNNTGLHIEKRVNELLRAAQITEHLHSNSYINLLYNSVSALKHRPLWLSIDVTNTESFSPVVSLCRVIFWDVLEETGLLESSWTFYISTGHWSCWCAFFGTIHVQDALSHFYFPPRTQHWSDSWSGGRWLRPVTQTHHSRVIADNSAQMRAIAIIYV